MPTESGDRKLLGNYRQLIDLVSADVNYNPANADITKASLTAHYAGSLAALDDVAAKNAPNKMATSDRQAAYEPLSGLMRRSFNMLKASGVSKGVLDDAQTHLRKVTGARTSAADYSRVASRYSKMAGGYSKSDAGAYSESAGRHCAIKLT
jgi:hypothetical protein